MKGGIRLIILEKLGEAARLADDLFFIFTLPYGSSLGKMRHELAKKHATEAKKSQAKQERLRFHDLLYRLHQDHLIENIRKDSKKFIRITQKGRKYLRKLRLNRSSALPDTGYQRGSDNVLKIVIFDIPEVMKRRRDWLRSALKNMGFTMLQKSVWVGKTQLPQEFIEDARKLGLLPYVEIFAISKTGSLKQLKP